ncbi:MAG: FKBP-type peptidyl-prolyl cis-trans isomerase [Akkermansiaceae bacterium]
MKHSLKLILVVTLYTANVLGLMAQENDLTAPAEVAKAPEDALVTDSGLASKVLTPGTGTEHPSARDTVTVHYTGWQSSDGSMFDSSVKRGEPTSFPLNQVIAGWTEGVQLMVVGEKRRFWIPEGLAYGPVQPGSGRPGGQLVFDVELISIEKGPEPIKVPEEAEKTKSGLSYIITAPGEGAVPTDEQNIKFHFSFFGPDGKVAQSSKQRGSGETAPMAKLPPFFAEVFVKLMPGGKAETYIPGSMLGAQDELIKCELELIAVSEPIPAPPVPKEVAAIPADAEKTASGLAYKVIVKGEGTEKPSATNEVEVHYTGWETDGEMFDSSVTRGETTKFPLNQVIAGWTEGVQLMSKGDTFRFWIPEDLAYGAKQEGSGRPGGLLVFDVELVDFK